MCNTLILIIIIMQQDTNNKTIVGAITIPQETLAAIRFGGGIPQLAAPVSTALSTWGAIARPIRSTWAISIALTDAAELLPQLLQDVVLAARGHARPGQRLTTPLPT